MRALRDANRWAFYAEGSSTYINELELMKFSRNIFFKEGIQKLCDSKKVLRS
jgi:hypothetical protein